MPLRSKKIKLKDACLEYSPRGEGSRKVLDDVPEDKGYEERESYYVPPKNVRNRNTYASSPYERFLIKYADFENCVEKFTSQDLCYYFREVANKVGVKYYLVFAKDCTIMKRLREIYSAREICGMVDFLFTGGQTYLDVGRLSIGILGSRWVNTIYSDFKLWSKGKYISKENNRGGRHEWKMEKGENVSTVGVW